MWSILCFGDSNVWGNIADSFDPQTGLCGRYDSTKRWPGILQNELGKECHVIEDAINGRTTDLDEIDPGRPYRNGLALLSPALEAHYPIDVVVFMLGTNDTKEQYNRSVQEIAESMRRLINVVKTSNKGPKSNPPQVLLIAPQPILQAENLYPAYNQESVKKSEELATAYRQLAKEESCAFLDAGQIASSSDVDCVHLDENGSKLLGQAVAKVISKILNL